MFNLYPRKGHVDVGADADIIVLDPNEEHVISAATHHHNNDFNIYEGRRIRGKVRARGVGGSGLGRVYSV